MSSTSDRSEDDASCFPSRLEAAREGTAGQQAELLCSFRDYLRAVAVHAIGTEADGKLSASDLVQSALIDACKSFSKCRATGEDDLKAWLRQILMNDIANRYRFWRRQKRDFAKEVSITTNCLRAPASDSPEVVVSRREDAQKLQQAVAQLSSDYATVIQLRHREKLSFSAIGKRMNRSSDAARMLWNRAVEELARKLAGADTGGASNQDQQRRKGKHES